MGIRLKFSYDTDAAEDEDADNSPTTDEQIKLNEYETIGEL